MPDPYRERSNTRCILRDFYSRPARCNFPSAGFADIVAVLAVGIAVDIVVDIVAGTALDIAADIPACSDPRNFVPAHAGRLEAEAAADLHLRPT